MKKLLLFVGVSFIAGFIWGKVFSPDMPQYYSDPQIPAGKYDQMVSVDVIRKSDDIWIVEHKTGYLIFEYNRFKEVDKEAFGEYRDVLLEAAFPFSSFSSQYAVTEERSKFLSVTT